MPYTFSIDDFTRFATVFLIPRDELFGGGGGGGGGGTKAKKTKASLGAAPVSSSRPKGSASAAAKGGVRSCAGTNVASSKVSQTHG